MKRIALAGFIQLHQDDWRKIRVMVPVFFLCGIAEMVNYNGFMTMFAVRFGIEYLPHIYILEAFIIPVEAVFISWLTSRLSKAKFMQSLYLLMTGIILLNTLLLMYITASNQEWPWFYPYLFISSNFVVRQLTILLWSLAVDLCPTQQAKRLMPLFISAATLGGAAGGLLSQLGNGLQGPQLVYMLAPLFLIAGYVYYRTAIGSFLAPFINKDDTGGAEGLRTSEYLKQSFLSPFLLCMLGLLTLMPALYFLMEYQYLTVSKQVYQSEEELGSFYGVITTWLFIVAFLLQLVYGRLLTWLGASRMLVLISAVYIVCFTFAVFFIAHEIAIFVVSLGYMFLYLLLYYFAEPSYQFFYKVLPVAQRDGFRYVAIGISTSAGILLGAMLQLVHSIGWMELSWQALLGVVGSVVLIVLAILGRRLYLQELIKGVQTLPLAGHELADSMVEFLKNQRALAAVINLLEQPNDSVREVALQILGRVPNSRMLPRLLALADDPSSRIRVSAVRAMNLTGADLASLAQVASFLEDEDFSVRVEGVKLLGRVTEHRHQAFYFVFAKLSDPHPQVVAEAIKAIFSLQMETAYAECYDKVEAWLASGEEVVHVFPVIAACDMKQFLPAVYGYIYDPRPAVKAAAIQCLGALQNTDIIPDLLALLPLSDREIFRAIVKTLQGMKELSLPQLKQALQHRHPRIWQVVITVLADHLYEEGLLDMVVESCIQRLHMLQQEHRLSIALKKRDFPDLAGLAEQRVAEIKASVFDAVWTVLTKTADEQVVNSVRQAIESEDEETRDSGLEVLAEGIGDRRLCSALQQALTAREAGDKPSLKADSMVEAEMDTIISEAINWSDDWLRRMAEAAVQREAGNELKEEGKLMGLLDKMIFLKQVSYFNDLTLEELGVIAAAAEEKVYPDQSYLLRRGELNTTLFTIVEGHVELSSTSAEGWEGTIGVLGPKEVLGETSALEGLTSPVTAQALMSDVRVLELDGEEISRLIRIYPEIGIRLLRTSYARIRLLEDMILKLG